MQVLLSAFGRIFSSARRRLPALAIAATVLPLTQTALAQAGWPDRPVKIVVGLAAGGGTDATARIVATELAKRIGQPVVVENRPGGGTTVAAGVVAKSPADGYTFLMSSSSFATSAATMRGLPYDAAKDFVAVVQVTSVPFCIAAHPSVPASNIAELIALAKRKPGELSYASSGLGGAGHLGGELLKSRAHIDMVHVPYRGSSPALTDLIGGTVQLLMSDLYSVQARAKAGDLKILAVTSAARAQSAPSVPTVAEGGVQNYAFSGWAGLLAPAGVPKPIVQRVNREVAEILKNPEIIAKMRAQGAELVGGSPEEFQRLVDAELRLWREVAEKAGIKAE